jgi:hypothetical protein
VIYYATDRPDMTVLIHEGLHAHVHPNFPARLRNYVNEGAAEYFTRQIADDIGATSQSAYGERVESIRRLVAVIGEEALREAYFHGDFGAADGVLWACGLERWAKDLQSFQGVAAEEVLKGPKKNYRPQESGPGGAEPAPTKPTGGKTP